MPRPSIFAFYPFNCFIDIKTRVTFNFTFATITASTTFQLTFTFPPPVIGIWGPIALRCARIFLKINNIIKWFWRNPSWSFASSLLPFVLWVTSIITFDYTFAANGTPETQSLVLKHRILEKYQNQRTYLSSEQGGLQTHLPPSGFNILLHFFGHASL